MIQIKTWVQESEMPRLAALFAQFELERRQERPVIDLGKAEVKPNDERVAAAEPITAETVATALSTIANAPSETIVAAAAEAPKAKRTRTKKEAPAAVVGEIKPATPAAPAAAPAAPEAPKVDVVALVKEHAKVCGMVAAVAAINSTGAAKVTAIDPAKLPAFIERLQSELKAKQAQS